MTKYQIDDYFYRVLKFEEKILIDKNPQPLTDFIFKSGIWRCIEDKTLHGEIWSDLIGYESFYEISNYSRIRCLKKQCGFYLRPSHIQKQKHTAVGYLTAAFMVNDIKSYPGVHRIMCNQYHSNPQRKAEVNHKNYCRLDNRPENLEWNTRLENESHARGGLKNWNGSLHPMSKLTEIEVENIKHLYKIGRYNQIELAAMYSVTQATISRIILNKRNKST